MPPLTIYTTTHCPACERLVEACQAVGIAYEMRNVDECADALADFALLDEGEGTVPLVVDQETGQTFIGRAAAEYVLELVGRQAQGDR